MFTFLSHEVEQAERIHCTQADHAFIVCIKGLKESKPDRSI